MLRIEGNEIHLTRGDTAYIQVPIENTVTKQPYELRIGDKLEFSVKKNVKDTEYCFHKEIIGEDVFVIQPADTADLNFAKYYYDVQMTAENGDVYTVIEPTVFEVCKEVTVDGE